MQFMEYKQQQLLFYGSAVHGTCAEKMLEGERVV